MMNNSISGIDQNYKKNKPKTSNLAKRYSNNSTNNNTINGFYRSSGSGFTYNNSNNNSNNNSFMKHLNK